MKIALILNSTDNEFSPEFYKALEDFYEEDRVNGYQRLYLEDIPDNYNPDEYDENFVILNEELRSKGYTNEQLFLVDNTW